MHKNDIAELHLKNFNQLNLELAEKSPEYFSFRPSPDKWTAGQHVVHLVQSTEALLNAVKLPVFVLKWKFGKSNRDVRPYEKVIERYNEKLQEAGAVVSPFSVKMPDVNQQQTFTWLEKLNKQNQKLINRLKSFSEKELDNVILPHPLMGKMIMREILMWNAYHTEHHFKILSEKYKIANK